VTGASPPAGAARRGPGRRPGNEDTRGAILDVARRSFATRGYEATTVRGIAREAQVDPALVHHYFGGKDRIFVAAMDFPVDPAEIVPSLLAGGEDGIGERVVRLFLSAWDSPRSREQLLGLVRSAVTNEAAADMLRGFISRELLGRIARGVQAPDPDLRATLVGSQLIGLGMARYVLRVEPLASADPEKVVALLAPTIERYLTGG